MNKLTLIKISTYQKHLSISTYQKPIDADYSVFSKEIETDPKSYTEN